MKIKTFLISVLAVLSLTGCKEDVLTITDTTVTVDESDIALDYLAGASKEVSMKTSAKYFKIFTSSDGVGVNTTSIIEVKDGEISKGNYTSINNFKYSLIAVDGGYNFSISALNENSTAEEIVEYYVLKSATSTVSFKIHQGVKGDIKQKSFNLNPEGGSVKEQFTAASGKEISVEKIVGGDWIEYTLDKATGSVELKLAYWKAEDGLLDRSAAVRVSNTSEGTIDFIVNQAAPFVKLDKTIVLIEGSDNISEIVSVETNMPKGSIKVSDKIDADDPDNRISITDLIYADETSRNATFSINVNMSGASADTPILCKYKIIGIGDAEGLTQIESEISVSRSQILYVECFENTNGKTFYNYWEESSKKTGIDYVNHLFNESPLIYFDNNGEYFLSNIGKTLQRDYFANSNTIDIIYNSQEFSEVKVGGVVYVAFLFKLDEMPYRDDKSSNNHATAYPIIGLNDGGTGRAAIAWVGKPKDENTYYFGVTFAKNSLDYVIWDKDKFDDINKTHLIVLKYSLFGEGKFEKRIDLFVNPELGKSEPEPDASIYPENNPNNDNSDPKKITRLFMYDNVKNVNVNCQIGSICVGKVWDEMVKTKSIEDAE